ncbi:MAG: sialidase family protein [Isosphaeraceae bacterium]
MRTPHGGIQPQAAVDAVGAVHVVSFQGSDAGAGDILYTHSEPGAPTGPFSTPLRVNTQTGSAVAKGTMRGAQLALGAGGRVHVVWNGSMKATPPNPHGGSPLFYTRLDPSTGRFEPDRNLMGATLWLDGGATVAADGQGHVFVAWHAKPLGAPDGEANRRLYVARSDDDGATFARESAVVETPTGACPCCGTRAIATTDGALHILYRAAFAGNERDMMLVSSRDRGVRFEAQRIHPWKLNMCPMSSASLVATPDRDVAAAWETQGQVYLARIDQAGKTTTPLHPRGVGGNRKHPALACNRDGEVLLAWAEDTSFTKGGALAWRLFDRKGKPTEVSGRLDGGIPLYGLPTAVALPDGRFLILH